MLEDHIVQLKKEKEILQQQDVKKKDKSQVVPKTKEYESTEKSIKENGVLKNIELVLLSRDIIDTVNIRSKYAILDGGHRIRVLRKLYGINHKFTCDIYLQKGEILKQFRY